MHTPGPWRISGFEPSANGKDRVVMGADGFGVAWLSGRTLEEHEADAQLIAAAPELLDALKKMTAVAECYCAKLPYWGPSTGHICYRCVALKVIAKATSEETIPPSWEREKL
jgi:hypothetical protein